MRAIVSTAAVGALLVACKTSGDAPPAPPSSASSPTAPASTPQAPTPSSQGASGSLRVTSEGFAPGATIPKQFTCDGADTSPPLAWTGAQGNAKSYALISDDPDAPSGTFTHWVLFDIPGGATQLAPASSGVGIAGKNDFGKAAYGGPCPPSGKPHHYYFRVFALDVERLGPGAGASRADVERSMAGHAVASGYVMGTYGR
jgi:Raf kinase inhibitor-like YbhB/YbcL family protein